MNYLLMIFLVMFFIVLIIFAVFMIIQVIHAIASMKKNRIFFHPTGKIIISKYLPEIIKKYNLKTDTINFVEIGAGDCNVIIEISRKYTWKTLLAIDVEFFVYIWGKVLLKLKKLDNDIKYIKTDCIDFNYLPNSLIYCYMGRDIMEVMYNKDKFKNQFVISLTFPIANVIENEKIVLDTYQNNIYIYDFRS